ncbi:MAG: FAD-dependent oxidoreductase [Magnetospirillum sp.]|nr:FAD-dependent oxidoreductase [Magnetospirillum sp.]
MATFLTDDVKAEVTQRLGEMRDPVRLVQFTQKYACGTCADQEALLAELAGLSDKLTLEVHELTADPETAARYRIDKVPATAVIGDRDWGIRFFGLTGGYEFGSLLEAIVMVSTGRSGLDPAVEALAKRISVPTHLEIMVTLTCPYCPRMVQLAHQLAFVNGAVRADMIDAAEFPALAQRYGVHGVPLTAVNERRAFEGALPPQAALMEILKRVDPEGYERLDAALREARGERQAREAPPGVYDTIVVGAGPAGMAAALYAVRKTLRVALIGKKAGGQINDTASIENYPGMPRIGGAELAEAFRNHVETYPVAERCHTLAVAVRRAGELFDVVTEDGAIYRAHTVIYAAGKQYRRLDVPGESRFLGRGVAFCATCDAPLFRDKRVAVVGGGNSAFTAIRDLLPFAREIHVIHMLGTFQADPVLVEEVKASPKVTFHLDTEVREFLGDGDLAGVRLAGAESTDLAVEGVFLEIGLVPNSEPLRDLVTLNAAGEVPIGRDQSTAVPGLFAAGDVTDDPDKQIVIAAGAGARAALAADRYLARLGRKTDAGAAG